MTPEWWPVYVPPPPPPTFGPEYRPPPAFGYIVDQQTSTWWNPYALWCLPWNLQCEQARELPKQPQPVEPPLLSRRGLPPREQARKQDDSGGTNCVPGKHEERNRENKERKTLKATETILLIAVAVAILHHSSANASG